MCGKPPAFRLTAFSFSLSAARLSLAAEKSKPTSLGKAEPSAHQAAEPDRQAGFLQVNQTYRVQSDADGPDFIYGGDSNVGFPDLIFL